MARIDVSSRPIPTRRTRAKNGDLKRAKAPVDLGVSRETPKTTTSSVPCPQHPTKLNRMFHVKHDRFNVGLELFLLLEISIATVDKGQRNHSSGRGAGVVAYTQSVLDSCSHELEPRHGIPGTTRVDGPGRFTAGVYASTKTPFPAPKSGR